VHVVATAGHVDHGKTTLVRALTGMEPDRLAEERRRGLTVDLGFVWTTLPTGEDVAFVDVPGHERFVPTMLAGVGPVPAVMFVVAADEGWKPQSAEHLAALDAYGVQHGLLVITRADLADPSAAIAQGQTKLAGSTLDAADTVAVSATTGAGLDDLRAALRRLVHALPPPDRAEPVRLWVDRAFSIRGSGTVVTGTLAGGTLRVGDELLVEPGGRAVRVRGLESLKTRHAVVGAVARVAVNVRGEGLTGVRRGAALCTPGRWLVSDLLDVRVRGVPAPDLAAQALLHIGSAAVTAGVRPLGADVVRLRLTEPLPLRIGDRAVLRDPGSRRLAGVVVLDVRPPGLGRRGAAAARATELAGMSERGDGAGELRRRGLVRAGELRAMGAEPPSAPLVGDWLVDPGLWARLGERLVAVVEAYAAAAPLESGLPVEAARQRLGLPDRQLLEALVRPPLALRNGRIAVFGGGDGLPVTVQRAVEAVRADLAAAPFVAPDATRLAALGLGSRELAAAVRAGLLLRVSGGVYLLPGADQEAVRLLASVEQPFTLSAARQALGTTRRVAVPLLELLDAQRLTRRLPDDRRVVAASG
jgi:selenocysteine-specific elongation factor